MKRNPSESNLVCFGRIRQLDKFHFTLTEELEKFEKDSQALKIMEKEFLVCILLFSIMGKREFLWNLWVIHILFNLISLILILPSCF